MVKEEERNMIRQVNLNFYLMHLKVNLSFQRISLGDRRKSGGGCY